MADGGSRLGLIVERSKLLHPKDYCRFIHLDGFTRDWRELSLDDVDLSILQIQIMLAPQIHPVVPGTGGIRKMRFSPPSWRKGKSGAIRALYAVFPEHSVAVLAAAYAKNVREDISAAEKKALKQLLKEIGAALQQGQ